ncbi:uncharacterized protein LOC143462357 [Clavelina lepadiformis]|uniref:uncharacterized protein LOC143462357 n=1 Tax=Clavelina lepadiformis TaxID=159417 RepID=UPI00404252F0
MLRAILFLAIVCFVQKSLSLNAETEKLRIKLHCASASQGASNQEQIEALFACAEVGNKAAEITPLLTPTFHYLDINGNGEVATAEIRERLQQVHADMDEKETLQFEMCDINHDEELSEDEYMRCSALYYGSKMELFGADEDLTISYHHLRKLIKQFAKNLYKTLKHDVQIKTIKSLGKGKHGRYTLRDFVSVDLKLIKQFMESITTNVENEN